MIVWNKDCDAKIVFKSRELVSLISFEVESLSKFFSLELGEDGKRTSEVDSEFEIVLVGLVNCDKFVGRKDVDNLKVSVGRVDKGLSKYCLI